MSRDEEIKALVSRLPCNKKMVVVLVHSDEDAEEIRPHLDEGHNVSFRLYRYEGDKGVLDLLNLPVYADHRLPHVINSSALSTLDRMKHYRRHY